MKKIYLKGYLYKNLGDDLFFYIISKRYPKKNFVALSKYDYSFLNAKNIKFIKKSSVSLISKFLSLITLKHFNYESLLIKKCKMSVIIGGSIFIEGKSTYSNFLFSNNNYYILGSNFGPYFSDKFLSKYKKIFSNAADVCFRDNYSKNLFSDLNNVRSASDMVLSLDTSNLKIRKENDVVISVINANGFDETIRDKYFEFINSFIDFFTAKGYSVTLMSFCKHEGDEIAIKNIISKRKNIENIKEYLYDGDIENALEIISKCSIIVGSRFHANILGLLMGKTVIPVSYSDKTNNVLSDLHFEGKIFDIRKINSYSKDEFNLIDLNYKLDVSKYIEDSNRQFEKLDMILRREKNE